MTNQNFHIPAKARTVSLALLVIGALTLIAGGATLLTGDDSSATRFWATLLQDSIFFLLISVASIFIMAATSLAQAAWLVAFRRIPEAIGSIVWILGSIVLVILFILILTENTHIYPWLEDGHIPHNGRNGLKHFFLSKPFFLTWSAIVVFLWG